MKWVSVTSALPKDDLGCCMHDPVFVYSEEGGPSRIGIAQYYEEGWEVMGNQGVFSCAGFFDLSSEDITHWMRIPREVAKRPSINQNEDDE